jgi:hypothetical protein
MDFLAMRTTILLVLTAFLSACASADDGGQPFMPGTTSGDGSGSDTGHADHGEEATAGHADDGAGSSTGSSAPGSTGASADETTAGGDDGSTTGAVAMDTWENWALPEFFDVYCNECHPGQSTRDFTVYEMVVANEEHIRCGVAPEAIRSCDPGHIEPGHLPIGDGPYPSDDERWRLVDWVLAGMPRD